MAGGDVMKTLAAILILSLAAPTAAQQSEGNANSKVKNKIESMRLSVDFDKVSLEDAMSFIREFADINIFVDPRVHEDLSEEDLQVTLRVKGLKLISILKFIVQPKGLAAVLKDGVLRITTKDSIKQNTYLKLYDVRAMLIKIPNFPGPKVELVTPGSGVGPLTGAQFTFDEPSDGPVTEEFLVDMVTEMTGNDSWDENPNASVSLANGILVVTQTKAVHKEIQRLLQLLSRFQ